MTTPSGTIGLSDVNAELDYSPTALISMNDTAVRGLAEVGGAGTVISMNNLRGKSNRVALALTISSNAYNYNVYTAASASPTYDPGKTDITLTIGPGVQVGSTSSGTDALSIPSSFSPGDTITIVNNGLVIGTGGNGGSGGNAYVVSGNNVGGNPGNPGGAGGRALYVARPTTITNNATIAGGGGGGNGGSGGGYSQHTSDAFYAYTNGGGGGGGGAGYNAGNGGSGGQGSNAYFGNPGGSGTANSGGGGGNKGSQGGNPGQAGGGQGAASGGAAGAYISGLPFVTWPATGTRLGPSS